MGKRKALEDPAARKRRKLADGSATPAATAPEEDLWGVTSVEVSRPKCLTHGPAKSAMADRKAKAMKQSTIVPDNAQSYNPDRKEHRKAVEEAAKTLLKREAKNQHYVELSRVNLDVKRNVVGNDFTPNEWEETIEGEDRGADKKHDRKTRQQRNKARRMVQAVEMKRREKQDKKVIADADNIDNVWKELEEDKAKSAENQKAKKASRMNKLNVRVGRRRFKPSVPDLVVEEDIRPRLREQGKIEASMQNPIKNRFESFQARNIIPASAPRVRKAPRRPAKFFVVNDRL